jgi:hypothetical protein
MPACVTIKNIVNSQYIMYCGQQAIVETLSYSNLVTTGSMALPPSRTNSYSMALAPSTGATSSTLAPTPSTKNVATGFFIPTDGPVSNPGGTSPVTVFEIVAGAVSGLMIVGVIYVKCYRVRSRRERVMNFIAANFRRGHSGVPDNLRPSTNASSTMAPRGRASITTTNAMNMNDFISPIAHDRMARLAEARDAHAEELESTQPAYELDPESQVDESWVHPALRYSRSGNPSTRWSTNNAPRPHNGGNYTNREIDNYFTLDLPTQPAGFLPYVYESVDSLVVSPNLSTNADSPLIGGVSPLMGNDNRASVGEAPIRRGSITHMPTKPRQSWARKRCESPLFGAPGITNATGGGLPYTTPETALAQGYNAGQDEISEVETTADKANGHEDIIHVENDHEDTASHRESAAEEEANHAEPSHTETAFHQESATRDE